MLDESRIESLTRTAEQVAQEGELAAQARAYREVAEAELMDAVIAKVKPALRFIGSRPLVLERTAHSGDPNYGGGITTKERYPHRSMALSCDPSDVGPERDAPRANEGTYHGEDLFLREDGTLIELTYTGTWSRWQGATSEWTATENKYSTTLDAIRDGWDVASFIDRIAQALAGAVGSREKTIKADTERAERIRAVAALIKK